MSRYAVLALVAATGCATARGNTTWEEDRRDGVATWEARSSRPAPRTRTRRALNLDDVATVRVDYEALAHEVELSLLRFASQRREVARVIESVEGPVWPTPLVTVFDETLRVVERALKTPPGAMPKRVLIQTRVTMEVELDKTRRRFGSPPDAIATRIRDAFVQVAIHMRANKQTLAGRRRRSQHDIALGWPLTPLIVTSPFGYRRDPILGHDAVRFHAGVDLGGSNGDIVSAAGPGRVASVGWAGGHGRTVTVQHAGGFITIYAHLKRAIVGQGAIVHRGTPIGLVGSTGRSTGPHLHFEVRHGSVPLDPVDAVGLDFGSLASSE